ncbi:MAG: SDR family NAD(P)-dependent oxidoreductase, partial [Rhodobacteraceae bacterium]|nr:SDR family NAD(P)-dependent oxidoreductase [Paracoccaceae bacterium]
MTWTDRFSLTGRVALITGASSGIGAEIARVFADAGATILASGRSESRLAALADEIGPDCIALKADIASVHGCRDLVATALGHHDCIHILVNSAGVALVDPVLEAAVEDWDRTMAINLRAPFLLARGLAPAMIAKGAGKIINISSQTGVIALPDHAA